MTWTWPDRAVKGDIKEQQKHDREEVMGRRGREPSSSPRLLVIAASLAAAALLAPSGLAKEIEASFSGTVFDSSDDTNLLGYGGSSLADGSRVTLIFRWDTETAAPDYWGGGKYPYEADYFTAYNTPNPGIPPSWVTSKAEFDNGYVLDSFGFAGNEYTLDQVKIQDHCVRCSFDVIGGDAWDYYGNFDTIADYSFASGQKTVHHLGAVVFDYTESLTEGLARDQILNWVPGEAGTYYAVGSFQYTFTDELNTSNSYAVTGSLSLDSLAVRVVPPPALSPGLYWTDIEDGTIRSAALDGSGVATLITGLSNPQGLASTDTYLFWTDRDDLLIRRADSDGTDIEVIHDAAPGVPRDMVVTAEHIYWVNTGDGTDSISRINLDGTGAIDLVATDLSFPTGVAVTGDHLYWSDSGTLSIQRSDLDGANVVDIVTGALPTQLPNDIVVTGEYIYWTTRDIALTRPAGEPPQPGTIQRSDLDGSNQVTLIDDLVFPGRMTLVGDYLYWADQYAGKIQRARQNGTEVTDLIAGLTAPAGLVVVGSPTLQVDIDMKPGGEPNAVNPGSRGLLPVAILTTSVAQGEATDFDATQVDPETVTFGPLAAAPVQVAKVQDVDLDGDMDLLLHFSTIQTGIACGDEEATLAGNTYSGDEFEGSDSLITRGCATP